MEDALPIQGIFRLQEVMTTRFDLLLLNLEETNVVRFTPVLLLAPKSS